MQTDISEALHLKHLFCQKKADYTNQAYSLKLRINSDVDKTRLRIVTKYKDDNNWAFLMYDVGSWKWQYKKDGNEAWQNDTLASRDLKKVSWQKLS